MYLRPLTIEDSKNFFRSAWNEDVYKYLPGYYCESKEQARKIIEGLLSDSSVKAYVMHSALSSFIGVIVAVDNGDKEVEISYFIDERHRHKGHASHAVKQILKEYKGYKVLFDIDERNSKSLGVIKKYHPKHDGYYYTFNNWKKWTNVHFFILQINLLNNLHKVQHILSHFPY